MQAMMAVLLAAAVQPGLVRSGPVSNGHDFGSCLRDDGFPVDLRQMTLPGRSETILNSTIGRVRVSLTDRRFSLRLLNSPEGDQVAADVGGLLAALHGDERADVFVKLGFLRDRPVLYWRETYQHRPFRQGLLSIEPEAMNADWTGVLTHLCEGTGGVDISH